MARIRTVKPEMAQDEDLAGCTFAAQLLAVRILNHSDDEGYFKANEMLVRAACFPLMEHSLNVHGLLTELSNIGYLQLAEGADKKLYGFVTKFTSHQKVNRPYDSKIKPLVSFTEHSLNAHEPFTPGTGNREQVTGNREQGKGKGKQPRKKRTALPPDWILPDGYREYAVKKRPELCPDKLAANFLDYHIGNGKLMMDWKRTWQRWVREDHGRNTRKGTDSTGHRPVSTPASRGKQALERTS